MVVPAGINGPGTSSVTVATFDSDVIVVSGVAVGTGVMVTGAGVVGGALDEGAGTADEEAGAVVGARLGGTADWHAAQVASTNSSQARRG
jgi:hypothetical protein